MNSVRLITGIAELPAPDPGLTGWPWTNAGRALQPTLSDNRQWPRISIVTPSLNQGEFLERTIRSVLLQAYPNLEYIIIDGGSTDGSIATIKKYSQHLAFCVSEPDRGYVHAINKGLRLATGEIICWLNSDDFYLPGTLHAVAEHLAANTGRGAIVGHVMKVFTDGRPPEKIIGRYSSLRRLLEFWRGYEMHQPSIFWRREVFESTGYLSEARDLIADFDYWVRIGRRFHFYSVDKVFSCATHHARAKTADGCQSYHEELRKQATSYWGSRFSPSYWILAASMLTTLHLRPLLQPAINLGKRYFHSFEDWLGFWVIRKGKSV
jgi:glycosyltransferase involved in cell wall biosynthesis